ncbi:hypothetical protein J6590_063017 [Homalodisca vitripennis]|nr:hypothetical protein J6590_063017 [Homalodisca vitripennis]
MCHLNLGNLMDVQEWHITNRKCRSDTGLVTVLVLTTRISNSHSHRHRSARLIWLVDILVLVSAGDRENQYLNESVSTITQRPGEI